LLVAQGTIPIFTWRSHTSYNQVIDVAAAENRIYAASPNGLFFIDLEENSVNRLTKSNGLSAVSIGAIGFEPNSKTLVIGYSNGNIDLLRGTTITNVRTVLESPTTVNKSFKKVSFNNQLAYLSGDLGIIVLDLSIDEITASYLNLGENGQAVSINDLAFTQERIFAASADGILSASLNTQINRQDFNNWNRVFQGLNFDHINSNSNQIYAASETDIFTNASGQWQYLLSASQSVSTMTTINQQLILLTASNLFSIENAELRPIHTFEQNNTAKNDLIFHQNNFWVGDSFSGLIRINNGTERSFKPSGPNTDDTWAITKVNNQLIKLSGGFDDNINVLNRSSFISTFDFLSGWSSNTVLTQAGDSVKDLIGFQLLQRNGEERFVASHSKGLFRIENQTATPIQAISPNTTIVSNFNTFNLTGMAKENSKLWTTNYSATPTLHSWDFDSDTWQSFALTNSRARFPIGIFIAPNGNKWIPIDDDRGGGIVVFDDINRAERYLNTNGGQGGLPGSLVTSFATDDNLFLWIGTDEGICFFSNPDFVLNGQSLTANVPIFENRLLLSDEFITTIAVDPANRKWFGTKNNGLWLFSDTGETLIQRFTSENSPLPSNAITTIYVEEESGEVFIGTDKGLVSFRSDATKGTFKHENVEIYPNPVTSNFTGEIIIKGLVNNAKVKITDVSGKLIKETQANGSTATWNGRNVNGGRVQTGVYLVFSSNADGTETFVGKIVVI
jgi:ligand-binding sensor domain-containing protein